MRDHVDVFKRAAGDALWFATSADPSIRTSWRRGATVVVVAVAIGCFVVGVSATMNGVTAVKRFAGGILPIRV